MENGLNLFNVTIIYIIATIVEITYKHFFLCLRAGILNKPGIRLIAKGYKSEVAKLMRVSLMRYVCVFLYTAQKQAK